MKNSRFIVLYFLLCLTTMSSAKEYKHSIKTNCNINDLFIGNGLAFESVEYEYYLNKMHSLGLRIGWDLKTSKLEISNDKKSSTKRNLLFGLDYYFFLLKNISNSGVYINPEIYYSNSFQSATNTNSYAYGANIGFGYRHCFNFIVLDLSIKTDLSYLYEKNETYIYKTKEFTPFQAILSFGFIF